MINGLLWNSTELFTHKMGKFKPAYPRSTLDNNTQRMYSLFVAAAMYNYLIDTSTAITSPQSPSVPRQSLVDLMLPGKACEIQSLPGSSSAGWESQNSTRPTPSPSPSPSKSSPVNLSLHGKEDEKQPLCGSSPTGWASCDDLEMARAEYRTYLATLKNLTLSNADPLDVYLAEFQLKKAAKILDWIMELRSRPLDQPDPPAVDPGSPTYSEFDDIQYTEL
jgi:hypothetical protein